MYVNLLASVDKTRTVSIPEAALLALLGFTVVLLGISFLILMVWLVGKVLSSSKGKNVKVEKTIVNPQVIESLAVSETDEVSEETVAVIMAALTAYYQKTNAKCEFTVRRIKRI